MKNRSVLYVLFVYLIIIFLCVPIQSSDECNAPPPEGPPPDNSDDNFSYNLQGIQSSLNPYYLERYPFISILKNGNTESMDNLLAKIGRQCLYVDENFYPQETLKKISLLIIPTGGLWGTGKSEYFKTLLENFLNSGGHILCYAQQDSLDFQVIPVPAGESIHGLGWRNSQSCYHGSIYFSQTGPIFAGQTSQRISAGVDGGFSSVPAGTSVLIRRITNQEPAMIAYPYGENGGMVYLSATYPDWSLAHGACTLSELKLVRDLLSYLKNPHLPIPMFDMSTNQTVQVQLNVKKKYNRFYCFKGIIENIYTL
jgi:hypothetical protein